MSVSPGAALARRHGRPARTAGAAAALLCVVAGVRLLAVSLAERRWLATYYPPERVVEAITALIVGIPVCVVAVLLIADRSGFGAGILLLIVGTIWVVPPAVLDVLTLHDFGMMRDIATVSLVAIGDFRELSVLLLVLFFLRDPPLKRWQWCFVVAGGVAYLGRAALAAVGEPGLLFSLNPWASTPAGEWAGALLDSADEVLEWVRWAVTAVVTVELAHRAFGAGTRRDRWMWVLLAPAYWSCAFLLLSDIEGMFATVAARGAGVAVWVAVICLTVARTGMWRLEYVTFHRLADAFVLTTLAAAAACAAVLVWAAVPAVRNIAVLVAAVALFVVGWLIRPLVSRASLAVEHAFYGPRARPHEAARTLAMRLQQAPHPGDVPEQICRSVVEDLGLSGAAIDVETRLGSRRLAAFGTPVTEPRQVFSLRHHGQLMGHLLVARGDASTPVGRDSDLLTLLAAQAGPALAALRLGEEAQAARERLVLAREEERRRLRREIHDGLGPQLAAVRLRLGIAQAHTPSDSTPSEQLRLASEGLGEALIELRRITAGLTPATLVEHGLPAAVTALAHRLSTDELRVTVTGPPTPLPAMPAAVETAAYRIAAEAVTNAIRHAHARHVRIAFSATPTSLSVTVTDDGTGFGPDAVAGTGLASLTERAEEIGGRTLIDSGPGGTAVTATLPITHREPYKDRKHDECTDGNARHPAGGEEAARLACAGG